MAGNDTRTRIEDMSISLRIELNRVFDCRTTGPIDWERTVRNIYEHEFVRLGSDGDG